MSDEEVKNKVVLLGDSGVGKTSLFTRFKSNIFPGDSVKQTRQEAEHTKAMTIDGKEFSMTLYDTAGMERFEGTVPPSYLRRANAVILVYAIDSPDSIGNVIDWGDSVSQERLQYLGTGGTVFRALVGNKSDLRPTLDDDQAVSKKRAKDTVSMAGLDADLVFEVSALSGEGVNEMFQAIGRKIMNSGQGDTVPRRPLPEPKKKTCCASS